MFDSETMVTFLLVLVKHNLEESDLTPESREIHLKLNEILSRHLEEIQSTGKHLFEIWNENPDDLEFISSIPDVGGDGIDFGSLLALPDGES